jgi:hypothetical protein
MQMYSTVKCATETTCLLECDKHSLVEYSLMQTRILLFPGQYGIVVSAAAGDPDDAAAAVVVAPLPAAEFLLLFRGCCCCPCAECTLARSRTRKAIIVFLSVNSHMQLLMADKSALLMIVRGR